jgi:long-chain fatty acid transport protein
VKRTVLAVAAAAAFAPLAAHATDGYFPHGHGIKAKGMGGASMAMTSDAIVGADNPAAMAFVGNRLDLGIDWFRPDRSMSRVGSAGGAGFFDGSAEGNETQNFFVPEFGYNKMLRPDLSLGVSVVAHGGMNTDYPSGQLDLGFCNPLAPAPTGTRTGNMLCGTGNLGVDLAQLVIAPTLAYQFAPGQSLGVAPLIAYQRFKAYGLQAFAAISSDPANVTNNGYDDSWGVGVRVGYYGRLTSTVAIGAAYATQIDMQEFDKYRGLFAEQGDFDIPENYGFGIAFNATPKLTIAADYMRINYSKVASVGNPSNQPNCNPMVNFPTRPGVGPDCLGASGSSIGFGWQDVNVFKLGIEYQWSGNLVLRAGYNHTDNPIEARDVTINILAPGVVEDHLTLGFTYSLSKTTEITMAYMHAFENSVTGPATNPYFNVGGTETISLAEDSLGIAFGWKF